MKTRDPLQRRRVSPLRIALVVVALGVAVYCVEAASFLVVDQREHADAIVVLGGEYGVRPQLGVELLRSGYAPRLILNAQAGQVFYGVPAAQAAREYLEKSGLTAAGMVCEVDADSTFTEAREAKKCLQAVGAHRVLLVTSDFHTRRALVVFRHELRDLSFSAAAARDPQQFGSPWWARRNWAKHVLEETQKLLWFEAVDRWK